MGGRGRGRGSTQGQGQGRKKDDEILKKTLQATIKSAEKALNKLDVDKGKNTNKQATKGKKDDQGSKSNSSGRGRGESRGRGGSAGRGTTTGRGTSAGRGTSTGRGTSVGRGTNTGRGNCAGRGTNTGRGNSAGRGTNTGRGGTRGGSHSTGDKKHFGGCGIIYVKSNPPPLIRECPQHLEPNVKSYPHRNPHEGNRNIHPQPHMGYGNMPPPPHGGYGNIPPPPHEGYGNMPPPPHEGYGNMPPPPTYEESVKKSHPSEKITSQPILTVASLVKVLAIFRGQFATSEIIGRQMVSDPDAVLNVAKSRADIFSYMGKEKDIVIELVPKIALCSEYLSHDGCNSQGTCKDLHLCKTYVTRFCDLGSACQYGHRWDTDHNSAILSKLYLDLIDRKTLHQLLRKLFKDTSKLQICRFYNSEKGCKYGDGCNHLHICKSYVLNSGKCLNEDCSLNHNVIAQQCRKLLKASGVSVNESPRDILRHLALSIEERPEQLLDSSHCERNAEEEDKTDKKVKPKEGKKENEKLESDGSSDESSDHESSQNKLSAENDPSSTIPDLWTEMPGFQTHALVRLDPNTPEYQDVSKRLLLNFPTVNIHEIRRLQNPYLWRLLQQKKATFTERQYSESQLNMQTLFHGIDPQDIDTICKENFDWRRKSTFEQSYGQGAYFSNSAAVARKHCTPTIHGRIFMFLAQVIIGTVVKGEPSFTCPPSNPSMNALFDTTVDDVTAPTIFVKYDKEEYYPDYVIEFY